MLNVIFRNFQPTRMMFKAALLMVLLQHVASIRAVDNSTTNDLRRLLFGGYDPQDIPDMPVNVTASLNLLSLNSLDIKQQRLSIAAYFFFQWHDPRLEWLTNPDYIDFLSVRSVFSAEDAIWTPPIIIENSVHDIDVITRPNMPLRVNNLGMVYWIPAGIYTTHCDSQVTYWPLDTQTCQVTISTWGITSDELILNFGDQVMVSDSYEEHGEWDLVSKSNRFDDVLREGAPYRRLMFTLTFRRRHLFHTLNTLVPVILFGFLTIVVFKLNPESGERVGLSLTILLAYSVYLGLISESIPQTSLSASLLSMYLATILLLQTLSVLLTVLYLDLYFTPDEKPVPDWLQKATTCLGKISLADTCKNKVRPEQKSDKDTIDVMSVKDADTKKEKLFENADDHIGDEDQIYKYTWKEISRMLDRVTMFIYIIFLFLLTVIISAVMIAHYTKTTSDEVGG